MEHPITAVYDANVLRPEIRGTPVQSASDGRVFTLSAPSLQQRKCTLDALAWADVAAQNGSGVGCRSHARGPTMLMPRDDIAARQTSDGWVIGRVPQAGGYQIQLLDQLGNKLRSFSLDSCLPDFFRYAKHTTNWDKWLLAYFTTGQRHFVARAWWGARLVIALDQLRVIDPQELSDELQRTESELVLRGLHQLVAETENGEEPNDHGPSTNVIRCRIDTLTHFPGLLGLVEAVPLLRILEERLLGGGWGYSSFAYRDHEYRRLAQASLRRLGQAPRCYPAVTFDESEKRAPLRLPQPGPIDGETRHANLAKIRRGTPLGEVYQLLGAPDEADGDWCYDVDAEPSYTVRLWLGEDDAVTRIVKYLPPFWSFFPDHPLSLNPDGSFPGLHIDVTVLQELASSGRDPWAPLARAVLAGAHDALGPLTDVLLEAGDPRATQICATQGVQARTLP